MFYLNFYYICGTNLFLVEIRGGGVKLIQMKLFYSAIGICYFLLLSLYFIAITGCGLGESMIIDGNVIPVTVEETDCCRLVTTNFGQGIPETFLGEDNDWEVVVNGATHKVFLVSGGEYVYWTLVSDYEYKRNIVYFDDEYIFQP